MVELHKVRLHDLAMLQALTQQQVILVQQLSSLSALLAARDTEVQTLLAEIDKLNDEIQRGYDQSCIRHVA